MKQKVIEKFLVIDAATGTIRILTKRPRVRFGEFSYRLRLAVPASWGQVLGDIDITLPDAPIDAVDLVITDGLSTPSQTPVTDGHQIRGGDMP